MNGSIKPFLVLIICAFLSACTKTYYSPYDKIMLPKSPVLFISDEESAVKAKALKINSAKFIIKKDTFRVCSFKPSLYKNIEDTSSTYIVSIVNWNDAYAPYRRGFNAYYFNDNFIALYKSNLYKVLQVDDSGVKIKKIKNGKGNISLPTIISGEYIIRGLYIKDLYLGKDMELMSVIKGFKQDTIYINFWGPFCPPCLEEIPHLIKLERRGFGILNIGDFSDFATILKVIESRGMPGSQFYNIQPTNRYLGQKGFPYGLLVLKSGKIIKRVSGIVDL